MKEWFDFYMGFGILCAAFVGLLWMICSSIKQLIGLLKSNNKYEQVIYFAKQFGFFVLGGLGIAAMFIFWPITLICLIIYYIRENF
jgi:hypothetical protein